MSIDNQQIEDQSGERATWTATKDESFDQYALLTDDGMDPGPALRMLERLGQKILTVAHSTTITSEGMDPSAAVRLLQRLGHKVAAAAVSASYALFPSKIGENAKEPQLRGTTFIQPVYEGAEIQPVVYLDASSLESGHHYSVRSSVVIKGSVPEKVSLYADGRITVHGDVGDNARLHSRLPENSEPVLAGSMVVWVPTGLTYAEDMQPAITVTGHVGAKARLDANAGIEVHSADATAKLTTGNKRPLEIDEPVELAPPARRLAPSLKLS